jgi:sRNA-binding protein
MDINRLQEIISESLRDWFKKEDWVRIDTQGNITGPCGTMKKGDATTRCLPRKKAQSLSKAERAKTARKKAAGSRKGKQFVKNTKKAEYKKGTYQKK